jgi:hypothetical protein
MQEEEVQAAKKDPPLQVARDSSFLDAPFTTMVPTPSRREVKRIKKGTYAHFETSLSHRRSRFLTPRREAKKGKHRRQVSDLGSWLEAWHIFVAIRVQIPLELVNYQSIIYQLFSVYSVAASLKYDKLFRQAEAKNKQQTLRLDAVKTCWFGVSRIFHFGPDNNPLPTHRLGLQLEHLQHTPKLQVAVITMLSTQLTHHQTRRSARGSTLDSASREQNVPSATCICWVTGCGVEHPAKACPRATPGTR